ncbi:MAG: phosphoglycerate kinase [Alphaproteobacteria bacterium]|nr:phosphoglycerate kinase [Alphaproteobacteria bacterium]
MEIRNIQNLDVRGKYILLREDFNVQIVDGQITDAFRINASLPTIKYLSQAGAKVVICSHLGRPKGEKNESLSLRIVAEYMNIPFIDDCLNKDFMSFMQDGDIVLLENLRFYPGEEKNDDDFAKKLASGFDIYVNDGFAVSHRTAASVVGVTKYLPSYAGLLLEKEIKNISLFMENPKRPLVAFVGGGKVSTKIGVLKKLVSIADKIVVGGAMGTTFNFALGMPVGNSLYEENMANVALDILNTAKKHNCEVLLPLDKGVGKSFSKDENRINRDCKEIRDDDVIMDDGEKTIERNKQLLKEVKTVFWNGSFGVTEWGEKWGKASYNFAKNLSEFTKSGDIESVVGGGDTVAVLNDCGVFNNITYVSTGGGAFLEFIEGKELPGISVLIK